jgi:hypothetical protein
VAAVPLLAALVGVALADAGLAAGFGGSSSEPSLSESSSLSLSLMDLAGALTGTTFETTAFAETLEVDFGDSSESLSSSECPSLDSEGEPALRGSDLDYHGSVNSFQTIDMLLRYAPSRFLHDAWQRAFHLQKKIPLTLH